jgi:hypothetical protein
VTNVRAFDPMRRLNSQAIYDCVRLGYLSSDDRVLDATYGEGRFWNLWRPVTLAMNDLDPECGNMHHDFTALPFDDRSWDVVVFDPPYKLNGTPSKGGPASSDGGYGVAVAARWQDRMKLIVDGAIECARVADRLLLVKVMDQVCSQQIRWQTHVVIDALGTWRLLDELYVVGERKQPDGRTQRHASRNYSTLMVFTR